MTIRPRRSVLYMPGSNARAIEKARTLPVDAVILDLEDSVAPEAKEAAREQVSGGGQGRRLRRARGRGAHQRRSTPNGGSPTSTWSTTCPPDAILVPKVSQPVTLENLGRPPDGHRRRPQASRVWAMMETPHRDPQCRGDRRGGARHGDAAVLPGDGHERSRQGDARAHRARPRADAAVADDLHRGGARLRDRHPRWPVQRSRRCRRLRARMRARRATWASTARR